MATQTQQTLDAQAEQAQAQQDEQAPAGVGNVPEGFPQAAKDALANVGKGVYGPNAKPQAGDGPQDPTTPPRYTASFKMFGPAGNDMLIVLRGDTGKELAAALGDIVSNFVPVVESVINFRLPGVTPEPEEDQDYAGQPAGFPAPQGQQQPAAQPWQQPAQQQPPAWQQPAAQPWQQPAPQWGGNGQSAQPQGQSGMFELQRLVMATTRSGKPQLQAYGPANEKATSSLPAPALAQLCQALNIPPTAFVPGNEIYNPGMPGAPRVGVEWYSKDGRYKDIRKLVTG